MALTLQQVSQVKNQLLTQIDKAFPADQKEYAKSQIEKMNAEELEAFLQQNNLSMQGQGGSGQASQCIFCSIIEGKIPSYKIAENEGALAVLDIRPASKGHTLIIPKTHISSEEDVPKFALELAKKVSANIASNLNPESTAQKNASLFGHQTINLIPKYKGIEAKALDSEREPAEESELLPLQKLLQIKAKPKTVRKQPKPKKIKASETLKLPRRIP